MADRSLAHETRLQLVAQRALHDRKLETVTELRRLAALPLSHNAGPAWQVLRGAALAFAQAGDRHPLRGEIERLLSAALALAAKEGLPPAAPVYTGGARPHFERPDA